MMIISLRMSQVHGDGWGIMAHDNMLNNHRDHLGYRCANQEQSCAHADSAVLTIAGVPLRVPLTNAGNFTRHCAQLAPVLRTAQGD